MHRTTTMMTNVSFGLQVEQSLLLHSLEEPKLHLHRMRGNVFPIGARDYKTGVNVGRRGSITLGAEASGHLVYRSTGRRPQFSWMVISNLKIVLCIGARLAVTMHESLFQVSFLARGAKSCAPLLRKHVWTPTLVGPRSARLTVARTGISIAWLRLEPNPKDSPFTHQRPGLMMVVVQVSLSEVWNQRLLTFGMNSSRRAAPDHPGVWFVKAAVTSNARMAVSGATGRARPATHQEWEWPWRFRRLWCAWDSIAWSEYLSPAIHATAECGCTSGWCS